MKFRTVRNAPEIVCFHRPIYNVGLTHRPNLKLRAVVGPSFIRYGVGLVPSGLEHVYERPQPHHRIAYFVSGSSGKVRPASINRSDDSPASATTRSAIS